MIITNYEQLLPFRNKQGIYLFTNRLDNTKHYAGKSNKLYRRIAIDHRKSVSAKTQYIDRVIKKYGLLEYFIIELIHWYDEPVDNIELLARETACIDFYDCLVEKGGYNFYLFNFDRTGISHTQETKNKISKSEKGKIVSQETKQRNRLANLGRRQSKETINKRILKVKKSIKQLDLNGNLIKIWDSLSDASEFLKMKRGSSQIGEVCRGLRKTCKGFKWKYLN